MSDESIEALKKAQLDDDTEGAHGDADQILCDLRRCGYPSALAPAGKRRTGAPARSLHHQQDDAEHESQQDVGTHVAAPYALPV